MWLSLVNGLWNLDPQLSVFAFRGLALNLTCLEEGFEVQSWTCKMLSGGFCVPCQRVVWVSEG